MFFYYLWFKDDNMRLFKRILIFFNFGYMEEIANNETNHPVKDGVFNYLKMKTSGALLVTGDWGCGKTYFFKNTLFNYIEREAKFTPIMVSLFGLKELRELPERVLYAYLDKVGKNVTSLGKLAQIAKNFADAIPKVKDYIDIDKLLGSGDGIYRLIPDNVLICFDDIERAIAVIDINEILGVVNELVENKGYKVVVIANESFIAENNDGKQLVFKEKVIEKTIVYIPNIIELYKEIVASYNDSIFADFMSEIDILQSVNPVEESLDKYPDLKKHLSNIRIIKFAIEHFYNIFSHYNLDKSSYKNDLILKRKLKNYWIFTLAVSIEYKLNNLSFEDNRTLDTYQNIADIILDDAEEEVTFVQSEEEEDKKDKIEKEKKDVQYANVFFKKYFLRVLEEPIFHKELYNFITAGIEIDYIALNENMNEKINIKDNKINPANELLSQFMNGYWKMGNDEVRNKLNMLLEYVKNAQFEDYVSYINATVYLFGFRELFMDANDTTLMDDIKLGINKFTSKANVDYFLKTHIQMAGSQLKAETKWVFDYIMECVEQKINVAEIEEEKYLETKFQKSLEDFLKEFLPKELYTTPKYFGIPILKSFNQEEVKKRVQKMEPNDAMCLRTFIEERYIKAPAEQLKEEVLFLQAIKEGLGLINLNEKNMTNIIIKTQLIPILDKALRIIEHT